MTGKCRALKKRNILWWTSNVYEELKRDQNNGKILKFNIINCIQGKMTIEPIYQPRKKKYFLNVRSLLFDRQTNKVID